MPPERPTICRTAWTAPVLSIDTCPSPSTVVRSITPESSRSAREPQHSCSTSTTTGPRLAPTSELVSKETTPGHFARRLSTSAASSPRSRVSLTIATDVKSDGRGELQSPLAVTIPPTPASLHLTLAEIYTPSTTHVPEGNRTYGLHADLSFSLDLSTMPVSTVLSPLNPVETTPLPLAPSTTSVLVARC